MIKETPPFLATGTEYGEAPTAETIRMGTVVMEAHPDYPKAEESLARDGFRVVHSDTGYAYVTLRLIMNAQGNSIEQIDKKVSVIPNMRWIDLQHEMLHVDQVLSRFLAQGWLLFTEFSSPHSSKNAEKKLLLQAPGLMKNWQNIIMEYHARLQEFQMLKASGVDDQRLEEHAHGVVEWEVKCWNQGIKQLRSPTRLAWTNRHFPDIFELDEEVNRILRQDFPWIIATQKKHNKLA